VPIYGAVMAIEALTVDDVEVYRAVRLRALQSDPEAFASTHARESDFDDEAWRSRLAGFEDRAGQIFVDTSDRGVDGVVGIAISEDRSDALLWGMWVDPAARRRGTGRRLLDAAVGWARSNEARTVTLFVMRTNVDAIALYKRYGFELQPEVGADAPADCATELRMHYPQDLLRCIAVSLPVPIVRLDPELPLPSYAHEGDAGLDLHAAEDAALAAGGGRALVPTGISVAIPMGYGGFVLPRSGLALKHGISVVNAPGLIDAAYRGEIKVILVNTDPTTDYAITRGDRIAQLVIQKVESVEWQVTDSLEGANRGGGFGHSGT
jgi:dUTP pyrophosphatase